MENRPEAERPVTIVDVMNEDCWRIILNFIDIKDIIKSERVSRQWQNIILRYLQGVRFSLEYPWYMHEPSHHFRKLPIDRDNPENFKEITRKWGSNVKRADCINKECLKVFAEHCPNLEDVTFYGLHDFVLLNGVPHKFKKLKRVHFRGCESATDQCIHKWLLIDTVQEVIISSSELITGKCFMKQKLKNLRALTVQECTALNPRHLQFGADNIASLVKLELMYVPKDIYENILPLFEKLPNLEDLCLRWEKEMVMGNEIAEGISRLRLKRLDLSFNPNASDEWMKIIARGSSRLQELIVEGCLGVSPRGVQAVCAAAGAALRTLNVASSAELQDHHVEAFIVTCPNLRYVDVSSCCSITPNLVEMAEAASRGRRLKLTLEHTELYPESLLRQYRCSAVNFTD